MIPGSSEIHQKVLEPFLGDLAVGMGNVYEVGIGRLDAYIPYVAYASTNVTDVGHDHSVKKAIPAFEPQVH